jgi:adenylate kinase
VLDKVLNKKGIPITMVLYLEVTEQESFNRIIYRSQHSGRADDTEEIIWKRIAVYHEQTHPLLEYYKNQQKLISIDGMGTIDEVFNLISIEIDKVYSKVSSD